MAQLIINRVNYSFIEHDAVIYFSKTPATKLIFRSNLKSLKKHFEYNCEFEGWYQKEGIIDNDTIFYGFTHTEDATLKIPFSLFDNSRSNFRFLKVKLIIEHLTISFLAKGYLVQINPTGCDLSIYQKNHRYNEDWDTYKRFDIKLKDKRSEIAFNLGSENSFISNKEIVVKEDKVKIVNELGLIEILKSIKNNQHYRIVANKELRSTLGIQPDPHKYNYQNTYRELLDFYYDSLLHINNQYIQIQAGGLKSVQPSDIFKVDIGQNLMVFGKGQTDINPISGMRDYGPFKTSDKATENKFIFIYENRDDANKLYLYLKNGLKHYPGLWSYVGIPPTLETDLSLKYNNISTLKDEFDEYLISKLPESNYSNLFVILIGPFNKLDSDETESDLYYYLKGKLLEKGIPSQFINYKGIRSGSFHYFLPNISVAILAKLGGVPWKLKNKLREELIVGFNQLKINDRKYLGSAVFFNNEGKLGSVIGFPESESERTLINHLKNSIENYIKSTEKIPEKLIIHYYKPHNNKERDSIENLIQKELRLNIQFAIVEINDTKTKTDICFDTDYHMGMPESGIYVRIGFNEYLLFNNTRYQKFPSRSIVDELPIKIKIHFADTGGFSHKEIISQIYEFSRLYWKALKQRSQPVTTIYSKLIAEFEAHSKNHLPNNNITHNIPWFL